MTSVTTVLVPQGDGKVALNVPEEWINKPVKLTAELHTEQNGPRPCKPGLLKDVPGPFWMAEDFDAPLEDFREYME